MKNLHRALALLLMIFCVILTTTAEDVQEKTPLVSMEPKVIDGGRIIGNDFLEGETYFLRTRTQEEQLDFLLGSVVPAYKYNELVDKLNVVISAHETTSRQKEIATTVALIVSVALVTESVILFTR